MSVAGFEEACAAAIPVRVNGAITAPVVSPTGLFLLKLIAWQERRRGSPNRDSADLAYLLRHAATIVGENALFENHSEEVAAADYDLELAASQVFGQSVGHLAKPALGSLLGVLLAPIEDEGTEAALVRDVAAHLTTEEDRVLGLLSAFKRGFDAA